MQIRVLLLRIETTHLVAFAEAECGIVHRVGTDVGDEDVVVMTDARSLASSGITPSPASHASPGTYVCNMRHHLGGGLLLQRFVSRTRECSLFVFHHCIRDGQCSNIGTDGVWK